jgi:cell division septation protein DedD
MIGRRRRWLLVLVCLSGALVVPTAAAPGLVGFQDELFEDRLVLEPSAGPNGQYAVQNEQGELEVVIGPETADGSWAGLNPDATFWFDAVFLVSNVGDEPETVWLTDAGEPDRIEFYRGSYPDLTSFEGERNAIELESGEDVAVGLRIDTGAPGQYEGEFAIHTSGGRSPEDAAGRVDLGSGVGTGGGGGAPGDGGGEDAGSANISVVDASLNRTDLRPGEAVAVAATFRNTGDDEGWIEARLRVNGTDANASRIVHLNAGETKRVDLFDERFGTPGRYELAVENATAGVVAVRPVEPTPTPAPPTASPTTTPTPTPQPTAVGGATESASPTGPPAAGGFPLPWLLALAVLLLLIGGVAAARQRGLV